MVNKTKIIRICDHGLTGAYLKDNYGNLITITSLIPYADLRFGDKKKIIFSSLELPLEIPYTFILEYQKTLSGISLI